MKCTAKLIYYKKLTKTGKRKLFTSLPFSWDLWEWGKTLSKKTIEAIDWHDIHECGGKIIAEIGCHAEPDWGGEYTYPEMDVNFICEGCKQHYHPDLPREETSLNEWLTEIIEKM